jgi:peroxiredoxin
VVYCYPRTGTPDRDPPEGWNQRPGARGCTPQALGFRDRHEELRRAGAAVFGLSGQDREYQRELVARLALPFEILSDPALELAAALRLPTFELAGARYYARVTLVLSQGRVAKWFYPVFPPGENAAKVLEWLRGARG